MNKDLNNLNKVLNDFLSKKREKEMMGDKQSFIKEITIEVASIFKPILDSLVVNSKLSKEELKSIAEDIASKINIPEINIPEIVLPNIDIPKTQVDVKVPEIKISDIVSKIKMPEEMSVRGWVSLMGVDLNNPLPVQLRDKDGKPVNLLESLTITGGGGGGKQDYFTIKGFNQSAYSEIMNADGRLRVSVETGGSGLTDSELRASSVPVEQVSGSIWSTYVTGFASTLGASLVDSSGIQYSGSNPLPVALTSGGTATTAVQNLNADGTYRDTFPVQGTVLVSDITASIKSALIDSTGVQYSGSNPVPISIFGASSSIGATILDGEGNMKATWIVSDITSSTKCALIDSSGIQYSGSNPLTIGGTVLVSDITNSVKSALIDSSGVQYSGTNPVPVIMVAGAVSSTVVVGATASDSQDNDSAPVKIGGIARTANPTPVSAGGDAVSASFDTIGRQITRPVQARGLVVTAYTSLTNGTETTLLAGAASTYHDLIYVMGANTSDYAVAVDLRCGTSGSVIQTIEIPASGTAGVSLSVPIPMPEVAQAWTADMPDITGTTVYLTALFSKEA